MFSHYYIGIVYNYIRICKAKTKINMGAQFECPSCQGLSHCHCNTCAPSKPEGMPWHMWDETGEIQICPHCGFKAHGSVWEDYGMYKLLKSEGVESLTELLNKKDEARANSGEAY